jgi:hypothetical protein
MKTSVLRFCQAALFSSVLVAIGAAPALRAEQHAAARYHDNSHNDDHEWNSHEDRAYKMWAKENHRKAVPFAKLKEDDQQSYWGWRHDHSDAVLKINIR